MAEGGSDRACMGDKYQFWRGFAAATFFRRYSVGWIGLHGNPYLLKFS